MAWARKRTVMAIKIFIIMRRKTRIGDNVDSGDQGLDDYD